MNWTLTTILSVASLAVALVIFLVAVAVLGTPVTDIGMVSTAAMFLLFGVLGLLVQKFQDEGAGA